MGSDLDPFRTLGVAEAAELAQVSEATLRRRIQQGELLHEVGRRGGRDVTLVRVMDLADLYPALQPRLEGALPSASGSPGPSLRSDAPAAQRPEPAGRSASGDAELRHALEVRLAALTASNDAVQRQLADLGQQRSHLLEQCEDLRGRLTSVERERQASTAGLLMAQKRLLELEGGSPIQSGPPWWRRVETFGFVAVAFGLLWVLNTQQDERQTLLANQSQLREELNGAREEHRRSLAEEERARELFQDQLEAAGVRVAALAAAVQEERSNAAADRAGFEARLEGQLERAQEARAAIERQLELQLLAAEAERERFAAELEQRRAVLDEAASALAGERTVAALERQRFESELTEVRAKLAREQSARAADVTRMLESWSRVEARALDRIAQLEEERERERKARAIAEQALAEQLAAPAPVSLELPVRFHGQGEGPLGVFLRLVREVSQGRR